MPPDVPPQAKRNARGNSKIILGQSKWQAGLRRLRYPKQEFCRLLHLVAGTHQYGRSLIQAQTKNHASVSVSASPYLLGSHDSPALASPPARAPGSGKPGGSREAISSQSHRWSSQNGSRSGRARTCAQTRPCTQTNKLALAIMNANKTTT